MTIRQLLQRYHISPLQYQDGVELNDKDYYSLFKFLLKWYYVNDPAITEISNKDKQQLDRLEAKAVIPVTAVDKFDYINKQISSVL